MNQQTDLEKGGDSEEFTNYVRPEPPKVLPPAKYKLWLLVFVTVFFAEWVSSAAGFYPAVQDDLHLTRYGTLFILLGCIVFTLIFGAIELVIYLGTFKVGDKVYGVAPWLKQPRVTWVNEYTNVFVQFIAVSIHILEDGFSIFDAKPTSSPSSSLKQFKSTNQEEQDAVLRIVSHVRQDKKEDYKHWVEQFKSMGCLARPGMKHVMTNFDKDPEDGVYKWFISFSSIDFLNEFMTSPVHDRMVRSLRPLLVTKTLFQLTEERELPDSFTDIATPQSQAAPKLLPKKWKVFFLTTMGLVFTFMVSDATLESHYYDEVGLTSAHPRAAATVRVLFNTFFNVYVFTPLLTMIFGDWLKRKETEIDTLEPWRTLNDGFPSIWGKLIITVAFYGGCLIAFLLKKY